MKKIGRRDFIKWGATGLSALVVGSKIPPGIMDNPLYAAKRPPAGPQINFTVTDALKDMVTHNAINTAQCYFWIYQDKNFPADCPGPMIFVTEGETVTYSITNRLDEAHAFAIPRLPVGPTGFRTGPIQPRKTATGSFTVPLGSAGTYLYYDDQNQPVNRVMGLHGAFIVMPLSAATNPNSSPYSSPPANIQALFNDLGTQWWPGLAWGQGDPTTDTPAFRQYVWLLHQASPNLFAEVGNMAPGLTINPLTFANRFLHDAFSPTRNNAIPQYFTISGQSGSFAHNNPYICPNNRVGEPAIIRLLNAGLWTHSTHIHANHVYVLQLNNKFDVFQDLPAAATGKTENPIWVDVYTSNPLDTYDWLVPYMRPPDVPNDLGIGRDDLETALTSVNNPPAPGIPGSTAHPVWPPTEELNTFIPGPGERIAQDQNGNPIDLKVQLSPLCFPMHDHSEPSQVAQGGNYNCGLISGINFTGDRKGADPGGAGVITFPNAPTLHGPGPHGNFPPTVQP